MHIHNAAYVTSLYIHARASHVEQSVENMVAQKLSTIIVSASEQPNASRKVNILMSESCA